MGIRYYAYAFDADLTEQVLADPYTVLSRDPLGDAWGLIPQPIGYIATFEQVTPRRDLLYLDKAWGSLQRLTGPSEGTEPRPAFRMFEGQVRHHSMGWDSWVRVITPGEVPAIAADLEQIADEEAVRLFRAWAGSWSDPDVEARYGLQFLRSAREFSRALAAEGRGMVYEIG